MTLGPAREPGDLRVDLELREHPGDRRDDLVVRRGARLGRCSGSEDGCRRQSVRPARRCAASGLLELTGPTSFARGVREAREEPGGVIADRGRPGVHLAREALDGILGAHELLEQVDAEVGVLVHRGCDHVGGVVLPADDRAVERVRLVFLAPAPPRHRGGVVARLQPEVRQRAECHGAVNRILRRLRRLLLRLGQLGAEEVGVQLAEAMADPVRRGLGDDEDREQGERGYDGDCEPDRADRREGCADDPAEDAAAVRERHGAVRRLGLAAEDVAQSRDAREQKEQPDAESSVVVHGRRMTEQPDREHQQDDRKREGEAAEGARRRCTRRSRSRPRSRGRTTRQRRWRRRARSGRRGRRRGARLWPASRDRRAGPRRRPGGPGPSTSRRAGRARRAARPSWARGTAWWAGSACSTRTARTRNGRASSMTGCWWPFLHASREVATRPGEAHRPRAQ